MAGWHLRVWRRMRVAPGVRVNFSKSGPSVSFGPRGAHLTVGRRGVRQTLGVPGTGLFATRTLGGQSPAPVSDERPAAGTAATPADYAVAIGVGGAVGVVLAFANLVTPVGGLVSGLVAAAVGVGYEWLAHHHPRTARHLMAVAAGLLAVATAVAAAAAVVIAALALGAAATSSRRRR